MYFLFVGFCLEGTVNDVVGEDGVDGLSLGIFWMEVVMGIEFVSPDSLTIFFYDKTFVTKEIWGQV